MSSINDLPKQITELYELVVEYVKSQTILPLKRVFRYVGLGILGAFFMAIGLFLLSLGFLRYLQSLEAFNDTYSFVPYLLVALSVMVIIGLLFAVASSNTLIKPRKAVKDE